LRKNFRKGKIRKILNKVTQVTICTNRPLLKKYTIYVYSHNFHKMPKRHLEKFLLYLK